MCKAAIIINNFSADRCDEGDNVKEVYPGCTKPLYGNGESARVFALIVKAQDLSGGQEAKIREESV